MAKRDMVNRDTKLPQSIIDLVQNFKVDKGLRYKADAYRALVVLSKQFREIEPDKVYRDSFDSNAKRVGFTITKASDADVKSYCVSNDITYQQAYFEFICRGLRVANGTDPI